MMVEAGGTERAWQYYEDGAPKVTEEVVAQGLEFAKTRSTPGSSKSARTSSPRPTPSR
jgi:hypothetical protein